MLAGTRDMSSESVAGGMVVAGAGGAGRRLLGHPSQRRILSLGLDDAHCLSGCREQVVIVAKQERELLIGSVFTGPRASKSTGQVKNRIAGRVFA